LTVPFLVCSFDRSYLVLIYKTPGLSDIVVTGWFSPTGKCLPHVTVIQIIVYINIHM